MQCIDEEPGVSSHLPSRIFLIGLMGAGKTTVGKYLAQMLDRPLKDVDHEIEKSTGASIQWIFEIEGESGFRSREEAEIQRLCDIEPIVLAIGGGVVISEKNRQTLSSKGYVIYLQASVELLYKRTARDRRRPLLQNKNRKKILSQLLIQREPLYLSIADLVVETVDGSAKDMAKKIIDHLRQPT